MHFTCRADVTFSSHETTPSTVVGEIARVIPTRKASVMKRSRIAAGLVLIIAFGWIASGYIGSGSRATTASSGSKGAQQPAKPLFRVSVMPIVLQDHARRFTLSGRTEADRRVVATTRASGTLTKLSIRRGSQVKEGDIIAVLSDEAREAGVAQARARLSQRKAELVAKLRLIELGNFPIINKPQFEAELKAAEAQLALAEAERDRGNVRAPIAGIINDVPVEVGQAVQPGQNIAEIVSPDPMLAVVEIAERNLGGVNPGDKASVRLVTGRVVDGQVRFISPRASAQTRTYRIEVGISNVDANIPDGVTCEVMLTLAAKQAAAVPRSALTFSADGRLGVRIVDQANIVRFVQVTMIEDAADKLWVSGLSNGARLIVQGQDFVGDGLEVAPVLASSAS
jgi:membrane fusion protein, multidrug efflux system